MARVFLTALDTSHRQCRGATPSRRRTPSQWCS